MLTGTPLQNDLGELHNLLSFLLPSLFKDAQESEDQNFGAYHCLHAMPEFWRLCWALSLQDCMLPSIPASCEHCDLLSCHAPVLWQVNAQTDVRSCKE